MNFIMSVLVLAGIVGSFTLIVAYYVYFLIHISLAESLFIVIFVPNMLWFLIAPMALHNARATVASSREYQSRQN